MTDPMANTCETCHAPPYVYCECAAITTPVIDADAYDEVQNSEDVLDALLRIERRHLWPQRLSTLAHNLAMAGGLCRAWTVGFHGGALLHSANVYKYWHPGCGRSAT